MLEIVFDPVRRELPLDMVAWAAHTVPLRAASLDHKPGDYPVEDQAVIKPFLHQLDKVFHCNRGNVGIKLGFDLFSVS